MGWLKNIIYSSKALLAHATKVRMDQQVDLFIAGLMKSICLDVEMQNPPNLATFMNLA